MSEKVRWGRWWPAVPVASELACCLLWQVGAAVKPHFHPTTACTRLLVSHSLQYSPHTHPHSLLKQEREETKPYHLNEPTLQFRIFNIFYVLLHFFPYFFFVTFLRKCWLVVVTFFFGSLSCRELKPAAALQRKKEADTFGSGKLGSEKEQSF